MKETAADLARRLAENAEAVCREYLSNGRREGSTWRVGDVENTPGRSLMVRLVDSTHGAAGKWTHFATGEHGDLLDLIARSRRLEDFRDVAEEVLLKALKLGEAQSSATVGFVLENLPRRLAERYVEELAGLTDVSRKEGESAQIEITKAIQAQAKAGTIRFIEKDSAFG